MREKLIKILQNKPYGYSSYENFADYLITNGIVVSSWVSVDEKLPEKDGKYIVARKEGSRYSISVRKFRKEVPCWYRGYCGHWERRTVGITHWMPLPEPPLKGEDHDSRKI